MKQVTRLRGAAVMMLGWLACCPEQVLAQVPPRFYWKTLSGANAVPLIGESLSGNTNPFDPGHRVTSGANVSANIALVGYARVFTLFNRSAMGAVLLPMGRLSGETTAAGKSFNQASQGFGDPMIEFDFNVLGPKAQKNLPDAVRYQPKFSLDLLTDLAFPIGEYDSSQPLNLGQHRWYGRVGAPVLWQLGPWVPGRRTTLEFLPAVWWFGTNGNFVGQTMKTDPMFQVDGHLTRDFTENFWGSLDGTWFYGGRATINGVAGKMLNNAGVGLRLGYQINDNLGLTFGYKSTVNDNAPSDLRLDRFMISLVVGWHPIIEGSKRLKHD